MAQQRNASLIDWRGAYFVTLTNSAIFATLALLAWGFGIESNTINGTIALLFAIGGVCSGYLLIVNGGVLAALPYFVIGSSVFFGAGTFIATIQTESMAHLSFTEDTQRQMLSKVNAANALALFIVVAVTGLFAMYSGPSGSRQDGLRSVIASFQGARTKLMYASAMVVSLMWITFPNSENPLILSLVNLLTGIPLFAILLGGAMWLRLTGTSRYLVIFLALLMAMHGVLALRKLHALLPFLALGLGWWLNGQMRRQALALFAILIVIYFALFAELVRLGRYHAGYDPVLNNPIQRVEIIIDTIDKFNELGDLDRGGVIMQRFTIAPFEAHFMGLFDSGSPGESFKEFFAVLVPRVIWPDKPIIAPGRDFDLAFRGLELESSLAIGFIAESYWNLGWLGVIVISIMIGLEIGWLTRKWLLFCEHGAAHIGVFLLSPLVVLAAVWVETNIVAGYVGSMVKLFILITLFDLVARAFLSRRRTRDEMSRPIFQEGSRA